MGVIRGSGRGVIKSGTTFVGSSNAGISFASTALMSTTGITLTETTVVTPFKTDASALGSYVLSSAGSAKSRFSEAPIQSATQPTYRDRAAERRNLYGSSTVRDENLGESSKHG